MNPMMKRLLLEPQGIVKRGLVAWYDFTDPAGSQVLTDKSGYGNHGQNGSDAGADTNDVTFDGKGAMFSTDDYIVCDSSLANMIPSSFTINVVAKYTSGTKSPLVAFDATHGVFLFYTGGMSGAFLYLGDNNWQYFNWLPTAGKTYFLSFSVPGNRDSDIRNLSFSVNGQDILALGSPSSNGAQAAKTLFNIGGIGTNYLNGDIYFLTVHNCALTNTDIIKYYRAIKKVMSERGVILG